MDEIVSGSNNELNKIVAGSKEKIKNLSISKKMIIGLSPSTRILNYARKNDFGLIVINSNNKGNLARFFLGSVSEDVIRGSVCPVLTIRKNPRLKMRAEKKISVALFIFIMGFAGGLLTFSNIQNSHPFLTYVIVLVLLISALFFAYKTIK